MVIINLGIVNLVTKHREGEDELLSEFKSIFNAIIPILSLKKGHQ